MLYHIIFLLIILTHCGVNSQTKDWTYACDSLICDPPKMCIVQDQAPITNGLPDLFAGPSFTQPAAPTPAPPAFTIPEFDTTTTPFVIQDTTTTTLSPFAPFLNLFGGGGAAPLTLPTLPTLAPPTTTTVSTTPKVDICTLPPLTGTCSRARIMWYYDTETGKCERFSYSGCGNENRFASKMQCEQACLRGAK